jgi:hypothetical protein
MGHHLFEQLLRCRMGGKFLWDACPLSWSHPLLWLILFCLFLLFSICFPLYWTLHLSPPALWQDFWFLEPSGRPIVGHCSFCFLLHSLDPQQMTKWPAHCWLWFVLLFIAFFGSTTDDTFSMWVWGAGVFWSTQLLKIHWYYDFQNNWSFALCSVAHERMRKSKQRRRIFAQDGSSFRIKTSHSTLLFMCDMTTEQHHVTKWSKHRQRKARRKMSTITCFGNRSMLQYTR